ncbi:hypothetical protein [Lichenicoccus sp.]|uniref:hypothetical protein n=1 Tax=Lichenicoccus sp. TaxID=2781899 RepID=UPI003D103822
MFHVRYGSGMALTNLRIPVAEADTARTMNTVAKLVALLGPPAALGQPRMIRFRPSASTPTTTTLAAQMPMNQSMRMVNDRDAAIRSGSIIASLL